MDDNDIQSRSSVSSRNRIYTQDWCHLAVQFASNQAISYARFGSGSRLSHEVIGDKNIGTKGNDGSWHSGLAILNHSRDHRLFVKKPLPESRQGSKDLRAIFRVPL